MKAVINKIIDLSDIQIEMYGNQIRYKWKDSIGCESHFVFGDISGVLKIIDAYRKKDGRWYLKVLFNDKASEIYTDTFKRAGLRNVLYSNGAPFKYEINQHI